MALIKFFPVAPKIDFMRRRKLFVSLSAALILASFAFFFILGLNFGVDFRGGILIEVRTNAPADLSDLRGRLGNLGLGEVTLQEFGTPTDLLINVQRQEGDEKAQIKAIQVVKGELGDSVAEYRRTEFVGPKVGSELRRAGIIATLLALVGIGIYIWFRFEWQFGIAALLPADLSDLRERLGNLGLGEVTLQEFGTPTDLLINVQRQEGDEKAQIKAIQVVKGELGDSVAEYRRTEFVGPKVGSELRRAGIIATLLALVGIGIYIWFRFEWQFGIAALVALIHDVVATIGFYSLMQIEFNLATLAAVLAIAGYSINDTVVIFDRVRETLRKYKTLDMQALLNIAINSTLSRTLLTSVTTLLALMALFVLGGQVIRGFSMGLIWGVLIGTYSSIALAVPLLLHMNLRHSSMATGQEAKEEASGKTTGKKT